MQTSSETSTADDFTFQCHVTEAYYLFQEPHTSAMVVAVAVALVLSPLIITTNAFVILAILGKRSLSQIPSNILLACTAVSDICVGLFSVPLFAANFFTVFIGREYNCILYTWQIAIIHYFSLTSFILVLTITLDRVLAIYIPFFYHCKITWKSHLWLTSFLSTALACFVCTTVSLPAWFDLIIVECIVFFLVVFSSSGAHLAIYFTVKKINKTAPHGSLPRSTSHGDKGKQHKLLCLTFVMFVSLILCYLPYVFTGLSWFLGKDKRSWLMPLNMWSYVTVISKSLLNPILYCYSISSIFKEVKRLSSCVYRRK